MDYDKLTQRAREMHALIREYLVSGLTQKQFCEKANLPRSTFQYWWVHFRKQTAPESADPAVKFIPLKVREKSGPGSGCHISYPSGVTVYFDRTVDAHFLITLINSGSR
jgi:hypothetical protein